MAYNKQIVREIRKKVIFTSSQMKFYNLTFKNTKNACPTNLWLVEWVIVSLIKIKSEYAFNVAPKVYY